MRNVVRRLSISPTYLLSTTCGTPGLALSRPLSSLLRPRPSPSFQARSMASPALSNPVSAPDAFLDRTSIPYDLGSLGAGWRKAASPSGGAFAVFEQGLEQSLNDKQREYRLITLENGLTALLVSDPTTDKAAVSLSVGIGHLNDPDDLPGLAHFCEHMLFLGTSKYPDEADYKLYLSQHAGSSNAFTSMDETNYHLDIHPAGLAGALSRHSQFFTSPLFLPSCTERELKAVDSEFRRNLQLDSRRLFQLGKATSSLAGSYWKFGTGSKETLWDEPVAKSVNVRSRLLAWYAEHYTANLMKLCVLSTQSLDELETLVIAEYSSIPNANLEAPSFAPALSPEQLGTEIFYRTIKDSPQLRVEFPLPDQRGFWATKPSQYLSHFIGHEGPGSILSDLKARGWATGLSAGGGSGAAGFDFFRISLSLTASGLSHYQDVLQTIFAYLELLKATPPQEWAFAEMKQLGEIAWQWKEHGQPGPMVKNLASRLHSLYPRERLLVGPYFATTFDASLIRESMEGLVVERCRVFVGSKEPLEGRGKWDLKEQYYSTEYGVRPLEMAHLKEPVSSPAFLALPKPNVFVPERLELVTNVAAPEPVTRPSLIRHTPASRLFYKKDDTWLIPRAAAYFLLKSPVADQTASAAIKSQLFTSLVEEALTEYSYDATLAGLGYSVGTETDGLQVVVSGYNDKLSVLLGVVLEKMKNLVVDPARFALIHDRLCRSYANAQLNNPSTTADTHLRHATRQTHWTYEERLEALQGLTPQDIEEHAKVLLSELQIEGLVHGNLSKDDALTIMKAVETILQPKASNPSLNDYHRALLLPIGCNLVYRPLVPSPENVNSASSIYYQVCPTSSHTLLAQLHLFAQLVKVPVFSTLRTQEQLGYVVSSSVWSTNGVAGFRVMVQSEREGEYLEERVEALWKGFRSVLEEMGEEEFGLQRASLVKKREEKPKNLGQEYWDEIECGELDFYYREREAAAIAQLTLEDLKAFFNTYIHPSPTRTKLSILMRSQRLQPAALAGLRKLLAWDEGEELCDRKPTLEEVRTFVDRVGGGEEVREEVERVARRRELAEGVTEVLDVEELRKGLKRAEGVVPVDDFRTDLAAHL